MLSRPPEHRTPSPRSAIEPISPPRISRPPEYKTPSPPPRSAVELISPLPSHKESANNEAPGPSSSISVAKSSPATGHTLLFLPQEIRNMIWELAVAIGEKYITYKDSRKRGKWWIDQSCKYDSSNTALYHLPRALTTNPSCLVNHVKPKGRRLVGNSFDGTAGLNLLLTSSELRADVEPIVYRGTLRFQTPESLLAFIFLTNHKANLIHSICLDWNVSVWVKPKHWSVPSLSKFRRDYERECVNLATRRLSGLRELELDFEALTFMLHPEWNQHAFSKYLILAFGNISTLKVPTVKLGPSARLFVRAFSDMIRQRSQVLQETRNAEPERENNEPENEGNSDTENEQNINEGVGGSSNAGVGRSNSVDIGESRNAGNGEGSSAGTGYVVDEQADDWSQWEEQCLNTLHIACVRGSGGS